MSTEFGILTPHVSHQHTTNKMLAKNGIIPCDIQGSISPRKACDPDAPDWSTTIEGFDFWFAVSEKELLLDNELIAGFQSQKIARSFNCDTIRFLSEETT